MKALSIAIAALALAACGGDNDKPRSTPKSPVTSAGWEIGPVINGRNYSVGLLLNPSVKSDGSFSFTIGPTQEPHYITKRFGPLTGKKSITIRYRIEAEPGTVIYPKCCMGSPPIGPTLYFQVKGDDWRTDGNRWWATFKQDAILQPGEYTITAELDNNWTSVMEITAEKNPAIFKKAIDNADRIGFTLGGGDGFGHGVRATGLVTFTVLEFKVE